MPTWFTAPCCSGPTPMLYGSVFAYSYITGETNDAGGDGGVVSLPSPVQSISAGPGKTSITFNGSIDDLAVIIPLGYSITGSYDPVAQITTVQLPPPGKYLVIDPNSGAMNRQVNVSDGTHSGTLYDADGDIGTLLTAAGFTHLPITTPIPLTTLQGMGACDANGNLQFILVLIPSVAGFIRITSATAQ